jgi:PAS domain S-box-containing protein
MAEGIRRMLNEPNRLVLIAIIAICVFVSVYVNVYLGVGVVYTHFYYIPIILAGIWYYRKAIYLALFLGLCHIFIGYWLSGSILPDTFVRAAMFVVVAIVVSTLSEARNDLYKKSKASEHDLHVILDSVYDGIIIHDVDGRIVNINDRMIEMFKVTRENAPNFSILKDYSSPEYSTDILRERWKKAMSGESQLFEWVCRRPGDGSTFDGEIFLRKITLKNRELIMATIRDITRRKRAEEARLQLAKDIELLLESTDEGIYSIDRGHRCTIINRSAARMIGYATDEVLGRNMHDLIHYKRVDGSPCSPDECCIVQSLTTGSGCRVSDDVFWRKDGTSFPVEYSSYPIVDNGAIKGAVVTFIDITERKEAEKEISDARKQAEFYVDLMGHDINNMNQVGIGYLEQALEELKLSKEDRVLITKPLEALYNSSRLIDNVRKLQAITEGNIKHKPLDIARMLQEVIAHCSQVPGRDVKIDFQPAAGCAVMADELLKDVFSNILGNAIKHSEGPVTIEIGLDRVSVANRDYCRVTIADRGPGIPDDLKSIIFTRFQRGKSKASGRGLGLYLVKTLVEDFGGKVWVEDRMPGDSTKGSRFVILLPALAP